jgi:hypothetical protein
MQPEKAWVIAKRQQTVVLNLMVTTLQEVKILAQHPTALYLHINHQQQLGTHGLHHHPPLCQHYRLCLFLHYGITNKTEHTASTTIPISANIVVSPCIHAIVVNLPILDATSKDEKNNTNNSSTITLATFIISLASTIHHVFTASPPPHHRCLSIFRRLI